MHQSAFAAPRAARVVLAAALALFAACAGQSPPTSSSAPGGTGPVAPAAIEVPADPPLALLERRLVARGLHNPRGMHLRDDGLLVATAGTGDPEAPNTGRLLVLTDPDADGVYEGAPRVLLDAQPSRNILNIVRRDEVFGMAGIAASDSEVLVSLAFFGGPSRILRVNADGVAPWGETHLNINDLAYDPVHGLWAGVASTTDEVVRLLPGSGAERILKIPPLASGQDAVPGYLRHDPESGALLVSLFSGSPEGEEGGQGVELVPGAGEIIAVQPDTGAHRSAVRGLTVPTDLEIAADGSIYVLEFCDAFLDPVGDREAMFRGPSHGGFRRFSGRLLRVDRARREVSVVATGLDAPSNLSLVDGTLYIAQGMGTPGRMIPGPDGEPVPLDGFIERLELPR